MTDDEIIRLALEVLQRRSTASAGPALTVRQLYDLYATARTGDRSWWAARDKLAGFLKALGDRDVPSLTEGDWTTYRQARAKEPARKGQPRKTSTINGELAHVKAMLRWGVRHGHVLTNPLEQAEPVKTRTHRETAPREIDIGAMLAEATPRDRAILLCAVDAGMRRSEIRALQRSWIDREALTVTLPGSVCKNGRGGTIPITRRLLAAIDALPTALRSPYVFASPNGGLYCARIFSATMRRLADLAGIRAAPGDGHVRLHDGRHAFATNSVRRGVPIDVVSASLRHASLDQTRDYVQAPDAAVLDAARAAFEAGIDRDLGKRQ